MHVTWLARGLGPPESCVCVSVATAHLPARVPGLGRVSAPSSSLSLPTPLLPGSSGARVQVDGRRARVGEQCPQLQMALPWPGSLSASGLLKMAFSS